MRCPTPGSRAEDEAILEALRRHDAGETLQQIGAAIGCAPAAAAQLLADVFLEEAAETPLQ